MHKNAEVLFEVDGVKRKLNLIIEVKQGYLLGPEWFPFLVLYGSSPRNLAEIASLLWFRFVYIMRSKEDLILTGRNHKTDGKNSLADDTLNSQYRTTSMQMTLRFHALPDQMLTCLPRWSWNIFEDEDLQFMQALTAPSRIKDENSVLCTASLDLPRQSNFRWH